MCGGQKPIERRNYKRRKETYLTQEEINKFIAQEITPILPKEGMTVDEEWLNLITDAVRVVIVKSHPERRKEKRIKEGQ